MGSTASTGVDRGVGCFGCRDPHESRLSRSQPGSPVHELDDEPCTATSDCLSDQHKLVAWGDAHNPSDMAQRGRLVPISTNVDVHRNATFKNGQNSAPVSPQSSLTAQLRGMPGNVAESPKGAEPSAACDDTKSVPIFGRRKSSKDLAADLDDQWKAVQIETPVQPASAQQQQEVGSRQIDDSMLITPLEEVATLNCVSEAPTEAAPRSVTPVEPFSAQTLTAAATPVEPFSEATVVESFAAGAAAVRPEATAAVSNVEDHQILAPVQKGRANSFESKTEGSTAQHCGSHSSSQQLTITDTTTGSQLTAKSALRRTGRAKRTRGSEKNGSKRQIRWGVCKYHEIESFINPEMICGDGGPAFMLGGRQVAVSEVDITKVSGGSRGKLSMRGMSAKEYAMRGRVEAAVRRGSLFM